MLALNENEIIKKFIDTAEKSAKRIYGLVLNFKKLSISKPEPTEDYKTYKNGDSSSLINMDCELVGWQSYSDDGLEQFFRSVLEENELFYPVVDLKVFEMASKGKLNIKINFTFVFTRIDIMATNSNDDLSSLDKNDIIREIEIKLSEIYSLLVKLKK